MSKFVYSGAPILPCMFAGLGAAPGPLLAVDFTALTPGGIVAGAAGGSAFETATGLRLTRASGATVQTSDRLVVSGLSSDVARIGQQTSTAMTRGLVLEEARTNIVLRNRDLTDAAWTAATATQTANYAPGPDGNANATRLVKTSGKRSSFQLIPAPSTSRYAWSMWDAATDGASSFASTFAEGHTDVNQAVAVGPSFRHFTYADAATYTTGNGLYVVPVSTDTGAYDELIDLVQLEAGGFATEAIIVAGTAATRAGEHLYHPTGASLVNAGRLRLNLELIPKGANGDYAAAQRLFTVDSSNYAEVDTSGNFTVVIGGSSVTFSTPITWSALDLVQVFLEAGGSSASALTTSINGATPVVQAGASLGALTAAGAMDLLCNGTSSQLSAWVQKIGAYA